MCEQSEISYLDGDIVWVKLGSCWWPGEVVGTEKLPPDVLPSFRKPPIAVVKFFQEDTYEYVKNLNSIFKYNCSRKNEFINKGLYMYRTKHGHMEKFPEDVIRAETAVGGDSAILTRDEFQEAKKESYASLFGDPAKKNTASLRKGKGGKGRPSDSPNLSTPMKKFKEKTNYKVHILLQGSKTPVQGNETISTPSTSRAESEPSEISPEKPEKSDNQSESEEAEKPPSAFSTPTMSSSGMYVCHACQFSTQRLNVLILHNKTHSISYTPYTPSPIKKKPVNKPKSTPVSSKSPKQRKRRTEKSDKKEKKPNSHKRSAESENTLEVKKPKTDEEIKSSLLADWDDGDEESADESSTMVMAGSPEVPIAAESPAVPTPAELPSAQMPVESDKKPDSPTQKPESSSDSKYEFCEDEDWSSETDIGRKIPFKSSSKRSGDKKSLSIDEEEMVREVAELLIKTTLPELPSAPEPLKVEENFPEGAIVKSPDKKHEKSQEKSSPEKKTLNDNQPPKTIFKTKTFFRSRHSRSQDAIGKYVAEQLNAAERLDMSENELNGSEVASSPEIRDSPPVEQVKVARLAPKIQFKKIKAEAAQQREIEKYKAEKQKEDSLGVSKNDTETESPAPVEEKENSKMAISNFSLSNTEKVYKNKRNTSIDKDSIQKHKNEETVNENSTVNVKDDLKIVKKDDSPEKNNRSIQEEPTVALKTSDSDVPKSFEPFMNESTASAVDALLSVSREADRVTKVISDDPPEDLFEDDLKDNVPCNVNGFNESIPKHVEENIEKLDSTQNNENMNPIPDVEIVDKSEKTDVSTDLPSDKSITAVQNVEDANKKIDTDENISDIKRDEIKPQLVLPVVADPLPVENIPSESDLQIAEALINLPTTTLNNKASIKTKKVKTVVKSDKVTTQINKDVPVQSCQNFSIEEDLDISPPQSKVVTPNKDINARFETEQEKSENLNAAKSLVQMSESIDHTIKISEMKSPKEKLNISHKDEEVKVSSTETEQSLTVSTNDFNNETVTHCISPNLHINSPKLLKILEEPGLPKLAPRKTVTKQIIVPRKEKILNVDVGKSPIKPKTQSPKQKIIIRRTTPSKNLLNNIGEITTPDKIILSRTNKSSQDGSSVQTYTIQTTPDIPNTADPNTIIIQQKIRQVVKPVSKLQKIKPQTQTIITSAKESKVTQNTKSKDESIFDINSMPIVLTPESIEKMPIVMSDGNIITNSSNPPKLVKTKQTIAESEKITAGSTKEIKPLIMSTSNEVSKITTPNILSKSSKLRGTKPMLVIDKTTGKQKIIMTKTESHKEVKQPPTLVQSAPPSTQKAEKFIILPTQSSPRPGRTQKIVIHPQTGKAHVLVGKASEPQLSSIESNKPVSAKLIPSASDSSTPGNTVMIITNAQGAQSRIVLTPEHEKILFPNKQQPTMSQLKPITHRITSGTGAVQKPIITTASGTSAKTQTRIVPKQKSAIITSKGQLIVGGRIATTTQNIAPLPEIRPAPKRILASEPKKLVQTIQKNSSEPLIFLRQNSSAVMQLTVAQFEHLQRTGQIIQKAPTPVQENKIIVQKSVTITPKETIPPLQKHRIRKQPNESPTPTKKLKHEIAIAPAPAPIAMPALTPIAPPQVQNVSSTTANISSSSYSDLENLEELLPSTAIVRQTEPTLVQSEVPQPPPAALSDGQLLAVAGEHFGGPIGSFYLCVEDNGNYTAIDNRPLVLENNQLVPMPEPLPVLVPQPERRDILEAALANSDVFHGETARDEAPDFRDLNANVSVHCRVSETSTTLNQPIMTPIEVPSKIQDTEPTVPSNLEDGLAVIGVTPHTVPTSLELPITVTDPRIAKTTDPLSNNNYGPPLLPSPNTELAFTTSEEDTDVSMGGPISMPILTDDDNVGKSMPILTDEVTERTVSSVESTIGSPSSIDVRESENEDSQWPRRLLTPCSDTSETSAEIPLQPVLQLSVNDLSHSS